MNKQYPAYLCIIPQSYPNLTNSTNSLMLGWRFGKYTPGQGESIFDKLLKLFQELLLYTSGDVRESLSWLTDLDKEYKLTDDNYGMADFIQELIDRGYIEDGELNGRPGYVPTSKMEIALRRKALEDIFG